MDLAALGAIGDSLTALGGVMMTREKEKLAERLEKEREERADQRDLAREQREEQRGLKEVKSWKPTQLDGGKWVEQGFNSNGDKISERPLDPATLDSINFAREEHKVTMDEAAHKSVMAAIEEKYAPRKAEANIASDEAQAEYYRSHGDYYDAGGAPKKPRYVEYSSPSKDSLESAFGKGKDAKAKIEDFRKWRSEQTKIDPEYRDGDYSLDAYLGGKYASAPMKINGKDVDVPAGYGAPTAALADLISSRRAEGKPDLSRDQLAAMAKQMHDTGKMQEPGSVRHPKVPPAAVEALRKNPSLYPQFVAKYGEAAAKIALGR